MTMALLERQDVKEPEAADQGTPPEYHWTVDAFVKAAEAGIFGDEARLELIQGRISEIMGQGPRHSTLASVVAEMLRDAAGKRFAVCEEKPVRVAGDSQPIPDISVLNGKQMDYNDRQPEPADIALLVEVSVTTHEYNLGRQAHQYAQAGIRKYWVVVETEDVIVVHRQPSAQGYQNIARLTGTNTLSPLALPETVWTVDALFGKE